VAVLRPEVGEANGPSVMTFCPGVLSLVAAALILRLLADCCGSSPSVEVSMWLSLLASANKWEPAWQEVEMYARRAAL
jgi:hypothetical protein